MKLFNAIAAAAVITTSLIAVNPAEASLYIDLKKDKYLAINDNMPLSFVTDGSDIVVVFESILNRNPVSHSQKNGLIEASNLHSHWKKDHLEIYRDKFRELKKDPARYSVQPYLSVEKAAERYKATGDLPGDKTKIAKLNYFKPDYSKDHLPQHQPRPGAASGGGCPSGQRMYRSKGLFGIGARNIGCMTAYEAESLRRQQVQNIQRNIQNSQPRNCYGTATSFGNTTYGNATCY